MPDVQALVNDFVLKLKRRRIEGSHASARQTAEVLRSVVSQHRMPCAGQANSLIDAIKAVGEQLIAANPVDVLDLKLWFVDDFTQERIDSVITLIADTNMIEHGLDETLYPCPHSK